MSLINEKYDRVICVNLKERPDKKEFIEPRLKKYNIQFEWYHPVILNYSKHFVDLYAAKFNNPQQNLWLFNPSFPNEFGTMHSHYFVIKSALLDRVQNLFVFEDDCAFHKDWNELLPKYFNTLPDDTDGVLLYSYMSKLEPQNIRVKPRWTKGYASWSFLAYGMNRRAMEGYVKLIDEQPMIADRGAWIMMTYMNYNFYVASPPLVLPSKNLTSNIRGADKNYEKITDMTLPITGSVFILGINQNNYE